MFWGNLDLQFAYVDFEDLPLAPTGSCESWVVIIDGRSSLMAPNLFRLAISGMNSTFHVKLKL